MPTYTYGARIRARLHDLGHTQTELADVLNVTPQYISHVLSGPPPSPKIQRRIEDVLRQWRVQNIQRRRKHYAG